MVLGSFGEITEMNIPGFVFRSIILGFAFALPMQAFAEEAIYSRSVDGEFEDIRVDVENAIINRGLVVDFHAKVGEMLDRTAADVGSSRTIYTEADSWQFCSAVLSRKMVEVDPDNIAYCPYVVFAYATKESPNNIVVGFRRHSTTDDASKAVLQEIDTLLKQIVDEVVN
jgi:hypothetical protein